MRVIVANVGLAAIAFAWWHHVGRAWFAAGMLFGVILFAFGLFMGIWCNQPAQKQRRKPLAGVAAPRLPDSSDFDRLTE
jgi:hypothetical protein